MKNANPKVDAYIDKAAPFAQPILKKIRALMHKACPEITEEIKWGAPAFMHEGIVSGMVAFKAHVRFSFWRGKEMEDPDGLFENDGASFMNCEKFADAKDLPADKVMIKYIKAAVALNASDIKKPKPAKRKAIAVPDYFKKALATNAKAKKTFENFSPSCQREYVEWITEAKREATREKRIATALEWMAEGKDKNWKYR